MFLQRCKAKLRAFKHHVTQFMKGSWKDTKKAFDDAKTPKEATENTVKALWSNFEIWFGKKMKYAAFILVFLVPLAFGCVAKPLLVENIWYAASHSHSSIEKTIKEKDDEIAKGKQEKQAEIAKREKIISDWQTRYDELFKLYQKDELVLRIQNEQKTGNTSQK